MQFAEAIELRNVGVPIPNDMIVEYSHLSRKADIADRIRKAEGTAPPTEQNNYNYNSSKWNHKLEVRSLR